MFKSYRGSSRALILGIVRLKAPITRVELASETGLTAAAVSQRVAGLIDEGFIEESQRRAPERGQPPIELVIRSGAAYMLGVHLEHSLLTAVLVNLGGTVLGELNRTTKRPNLTTSSTTLPRCVGSCWRGPNSATRTFWASVWPR